MDKHSNLAWTNPRTRFCLAVSAWLLLLLSSTFLPTSGRAQGQGSQAITAGFDHGTLSYQGVLTDQSGSKVAGKHSMMITLYADQSGKTAVWHSSMMCDFHTDGYFNVTLGTPENPLPSPQLLDRELWLGVSVDGGTEFRPLSRLSGSAYALNIPDNSITAKKMGTDYVSSITINGQKVTGAVNFIGEGVTYDAVSNAVNFALANGTAPNSKGAQPQLLNWAVGGNAFGANCANQQFFGSTTADNVDLGTSSTTNLRLWNNSCSVGLCGNRIEVFDNINTSLWSVRKAGQAVDSKVLGACATVEPGGTYNDNTIVAWGKIPAPTVYSIGPNAPTTASGGVKDFGVSCAVGSTPVWAYNECLVTLNVLDCNGQPLPSDSLDDASITVTVINDQGPDNVGEPFPNPANYYPYGSQLNPAFATVTKLGSRAGTTFFPGPLAANQFIVKTYGLLTPTVSPCGDCILIEDLRTIKWPCPFNFKVTARHQ